MDSSSSGVKQMRPVSRNGQNVRGCVLPMF